MIRIGILGYGYWGTNLLRNFSEIDDAKVISVCDFSPERLELAKKRYPGIRVTTDYRELIHDPQIDGVVISTPAASHYPLGLEALEAGKHVLIEKPLAQTSDQAKHLIEEAKKQSRILMVDHTFVFTDAVQWIKKFVDSGELGKLYYYDSVRINLGMFQHDVNVLWDLAVHDLSIMDYVLDLKPCAVAATGVSHVPGGHENIAYLTCFFESNFIAHIHVNWLAPVKVRHTLIGGDKKMIVYNDLEPSEKVKIYDKGIHLKNEPDGMIQMDYRIGNMWAPKIDPTEALKAGAKHFLDCIKKNVAPITNGETGLRVVQILEAANLSIKDRGRLVELDEMKAQEKV